MAEPIISPNSPLSDYLRQNLDPELINQSVANFSSNNSEDNLEKPENESPKVTAIAPRLRFLASNFFKVFFHPLSKFKFKFLFFYRSLLGNLPRYPFFTQFLPNPLAQPNSFNQSSTNSNSNSPPSTPNLETSSSSPLLPSTADPQRTHLSERLKYFICSSFLLNPGLQPALYEALSTPTLASNTQDLTLATSPSVSGISAQSSTRISSFISHIFGTPSWLCSLPSLIRSQATSLLASAVLILAGLCTLPSFTIFCLPFLVLAVHPRLRSIARSQGYTLLTAAPPQVSPVKTLLSVQSDLVSTTSELVSIAQTLDFRISRAFSSIKEVECVALGLSLSNPMPPVSRLERSAFPFALKTLSHISPPCSPESSISLLQSPIGAPPKPSKLHAVRLRKLIQAILDQARHGYEQASLELMSSILATSSHPAGMPMESSLSTLEALMDMYGCSRQAGQPESARKRLSAAERNQRQNWRASFHARISQPTSSPSKPLSLSLQSFEERQRVSPTTKSKRYSLQPTPRPNRRSSLACSPSASPVDESPLSAMGRRSRLSLNFNISCGHDSLYADALGISDNESCHISSRRSLRGPASDLLLRPVSPSQVLSSSSSVSPHSLSRSVPQTKTSPKTVRPISANSVNVSSINAQIPTARLSGSFPLAMQNKSAIPEEEELGEMDSGDRLSLLGLQSGFENMDLSRKRLMCCLLALEFDSDVEQLGLWENTLRTIKGLLKTVEDLTVELNNGMDFKFMSGSAEEINQEVDSQCKLKGTENRDTQHESNFEGKGKDFAPPSDPAEAQKKKVTDFLQQVSSMDLALRQLSAKMKLCVEELEAGASELGIQRAVGVHESIRSDLEKVTREWDQGRNKLRKLAGDSNGSHQKSGNKLRPWSVDSLDADLSSGRESSILGSELLTPVEDYGVGEEEEEEEASNLLPESQNQEESDENLRIGESLEERRKKIEEIGLESIVESFAGRDFRSFRRQYQEDSEMAENKEERKNSRRSKVVPVLRADPRHQKRFGFPEGEDESLDPGNQNQSMTGIVSELREVLSVLKSRNNQS